MEIMKSPLELLDFNVLRSVYSFEHSEDQEEINVRQMVTDYVLDFDYMIKTSGENLYAIFTKVIVNDGENKLPGHSIFAEAVSVFRINPEYTDKVEADDVKSLINFSAVTIAFSNIRGFISDITAYTPPGKYLFPIFDLQSLIKNKQEKMLLLKKANTPLKAKAIKKKIVGKTKRV